MVKKLKSRLAEERPLIQVVVGPRQVGKTTAVRSAMGSSGFYETADSPTPLSHEILIDWWNQALKSDAKILVVDEIQKVSGWSEVIKKLWDDSSRSMKVILTGSSALLLEKGLTESLAGRFELIRANHWNYSEASAAFGIDINTFIEFGLFYWKDGKHEVDFIVHGPDNEFYAIEVKSGPTRLEDLSGLKVFCSKNKHYKPCLVSLVGQEFPGIQSLSAEYVLSLG